MKASKTKGIPKTARKRESLPASRTGSDFASLVTAIQDLDLRCAHFAKTAVNMALTIRNWLIGWHIHHYELHGEDRAAYGERLLDALAGKLVSVSNCNRRQLYRYLRLYRLYPGIVGALPPQFLDLPGIADNMLANPKVGTASPQSGVPPAQLLQKLSYSHIELIADIDDPLKRAFYEIECIRGNWSVRELKRQIATLYFERSGLSKDKKKLAEMVASGVERGEPHLSIRDPYIFEFLGLRAKDAVAESDLEAALVEHLRDFLLELGHGFCLEAQQKTILIGKTRGFVDLVFYHRVLKCHVLVELKVDEFKHEHLGQLNTYVEWYRQHMMSEGDNPPVGLLLCTDKDQALVEYATAAVGNRLFVSKYAVELPSKKALEDFLRQHRKELGGHA